MLENSESKYHRYETITFVLARNGESVKPFSFRNTSEVVSTNIVVTPSGDMLIAYTVKVA